MTSRKWRTVVRGLAVSAIAVGAFATGQNVQAAPQKNISWLVPEDPLIDKYAAVVAAAFEKSHPGVHVQVITPGSAAYNEKLLTLVAAGKTPDIFTDWNSTGIYTLVDHQLVTNLNPYFKAAKLSPSYIPALYRREYSKNGQLFGIPWLSNPVFLAYNKTLFRKYHVPFLPASWADKQFTLTTLLHDAQRLTHNTNNPKTATWGAILSPGSIGSLGWEWGADPLNAKGGPQDSPAYRGGPLTHTYATRPGMVQAMTWLADLTTKWRVSPPAGELTAMSTLGSPFFTGRIGIVEAGGWLWREAAVAKPGFQWAIAPFPYGPAGVDTNQREDNAFYLSRTSRHPHTAFQFMLFATRGFGAEQLVHLAEVNPPRVTTKYLNQWVNAASRIRGFSMTKAQFRQVYLGGVQHDFPDPANVVNNASVLTTPFTQLMAPVWLGNETAAKGLAAVQQAWQSAVQP